MSNVEKTTPKCPNCDTVLSAQLDEYYCPTCRETLPDPHFIQKEQAVLNRIFMLSTAALIFLTAWKIKRQRN